VELYKKGEHMKVNGDILYRIDGNDHNLVSRLLDLPNKILSNHESNELAHMILHEIGHDDAFAMHKAGYLIDNPDFNCLKGVAGYDKNECQFHKENIWENPALFADDMKQASFNQQISTFFHKSLCHKRSDSLDEDAIRLLCDKLDIHNPALLTWKMKHGNHGILLYEESHNHKHYRDLLHHVVALLGLC
jgi:hypothetical protein